MATFQIEVPVLRTRVYYIDADTKEEALEGYLEGDDGLEMDEEYEDFSDFSNETELQDEVQIFEIKND